MKRPPLAGVYEWRDQMFTGQAAVASAAGVTQGAVSWHLNHHGHLDNLGTGRGRHGKQRAPAAKPITVGQQSYPSIAAFALAVGVHPKCAQRWVRNGRADRLLAALMAADARKTAAALKDADMTDRFGKAAA